MSVLAMTWAWGRSVGHPAQKLVLMALADHADDRGICHPGIERIAEKVELAPRTVRRYLGQLEQDGHIQRRRRRRKNGTLGTYQYRLRIPRQEVDQRPSTASGLPRPVAVSDQWPSQVSTSGLSSGRAEPSVEPSEKEHTHTAPAPPGSDPVEKPVVEVIPIRAGSQELENYLGEWGKKVLPLYRDRATWGGSREERGIFQQFGPPGMDPQAWRDGTGTSVDPAERPRLLALALLRLGSEGQRYQAKLLALILRTVIREGSDPGPSSRASPSAVAAAGAGKSLQSHLDRWGGLDE